MSAVGYNLVGVSRKQGMSSRPWSKWGPQTPPHSPKNKSTRMIEFSLSLETSVVLITRFFIIGLSRPKVLLMLRDFFEEG